MDLAWIQCVDTGHAAGTLTELEALGLVQRKGRIGAGFRLSLTGYNLLAGSAPVPAATLPAPRHAARTATRIVVTALFLIFLLVVGVAAFLYVRSAVNQVSVTRVTVIHVSIGLLMLCADLELVVDAPAFVSVTAGSFSLSISGDHVGSGTMQPDMLGFSHEISATLCIDLTEIPEAVVDSVRNNHFSYSVSGTVEISAFVFITGSFPFSVSGDF